MTDGCASPRCWPGSSAERKGCPELTKPCFPDAVVGCLRKRKVLWAQKLCYDTQYLHSECYRRGSETFGRIARAGDEIVMRESSGKHRRTCVAS